jgi:hypothetical protein
MTLVFDVNGVRHILLEIYVSFTFSRKKKKTWAYKITKAEMFTMRFKDYAFISYGGVQFCRQIRTFRNNTMLPSSVWKGASIQNGGTSRSHHMTHSSTLPSKCVSPLTHLLMPCWSSCISCDIDVYYWLYNCQIDVMSDVMNVKLNTRSTVK